MIRVERKKYEGNNQQRSDEEWKVGTDMYSQNAFVSGWPKKVCYEQTSRTGGWFPHRKSPAISGHYHTQDFLCERLKIWNDSDNRGGTTGLAPRGTIHFPQPTTLVPSANLEGAGFFLLLAPSRYSQLLFVLVCCSGFVSIRKLEMAARKNTLVRK